MDLPNEVYRGMSMNTLDRWVEQGYIPKGTRFTVSKNEALGLGNDHHEGKIVVLKIEYNDIDFGLPISQLRVPDCRDWYEAQQDINLSSICLELL